jgi:hypothetical protein
MNVVAGYDPAVRPDRADLDAARIQGLALRSSFYFYQDLVSQLARQYKLVQPR